MSGKVITVAQQKGGSGKTTFAANLAVAAAQNGKSVALIDSDAQGSLGRWYMARLEDPKPGAAELSFSTASAWGIAFECDKLKKEHDLVIVDTPPKIDADLRPALRISDLVVLPVSASHVDIWATEGLIELAQREDRPVMAVLNRALAGTRLAEQIAGQLCELACETAATTISNRVLYAETLGRGQSVVEVRKSGPAAKEFYALTTEILSALKD
ncbi:MAG: ParA family protein [Litoreibacter sp.]|nr:ParA family protein [Litoreibacter sp.]